MRLLRSDEESMPRYFSGIPRSQGREVINPSKSVALVRDKALGKLVEVNPFVLAIFSAMVKRVVEVEAIDQKNDSAHENGAWCWTKLNPAPLGGWGQQFGLAPNLTGMIYRHVTVVTAHCQGIRRERI